MCSGALDVYATPAMIALMENTAFESVAPYLEPGSGTVGTALNVKHVSATPVGMKVTCETELVKVDGRALTFSVKAYDEAGLIGEGEHERFIIYEEKFQAKADAKLQS
jgi:predicted thioesterase